MHDDTAARRRFPRPAGALGLLAAGAVAGGILASTLGASAATTPSASTSTTATTPNDVAGTAATDPGFRHGGASPVRSDEKSLSTADAAKVRAAALKAVPGGSIYRIETDAGDGTYEAHMTKADGSLVTVKLDKTFTVTHVESGMGLGDPAPAGRGGGGAGYGGPGGGGTSGSTGSSSSAGQNA